MVLAQNLIEEVRTPPQLAHQYPKWFVEARDAFEADFQIHSAECTSEPIGPAICDAINPGRRIRPTLYYALWKCSRGEYPTTTEILPAIGAELFHSASIIIDDIADHELTRRDKAPLFRLYDVDTAVLVSHYLVAKGCEAILRHPHGSSLSAIWMSCYIAAVGGQFMDLRRSTSLSLTEQHAQSLNKTLPFFTFLAQSLNICLGKQREDLLKVMGHLARCFQVSNDVVDLVYFDSLGRHDSASIYLLPPSFLIPALVEQGQVHAHEVCSGITYQRYLEISRAAQTLVGGTESFLEELFQSAWNVIEKAEILTCERKVARDFVKETTKPSFWLHYHSA